MKVNLTKSALVPVGDVDVDGWQILWDLRVSPLLLMYLGLSLGSSYVA
jgi:hypothetical protein